MHLKSIFAKDLRDFGASISRGVLLEVSVLTGVRIVFSSTASVLCRKPPRTTSGIVLNNTAGKCYDCHSWLTCRHQFVVALSIPVIALSAICRAAPLRRRPS